MITRLKDILLKSDTKLAELIMASILFLIGAWIFSPFWNTFDAAISYALMSRLTHDPHLSELIWGGLAMASSSLVIFGILKDRKSVRKLSLILVTFFWLIIGISFLVSNYLSTGAPVYLFMAAVNFSLLVWRGRE